MPSRIQIRRDIALNWTSVNPILADGEFGYETDTGLLKMGDGSTAWNLLSEYSPAHKIGGVGHTADTLANLNSKISDAVLIDTNDVRLSDDRISSGIRTATTTVSVSGSQAPVTGQVLRASSGTSASWSDDKYAQSIVVAKSGGDFTSILSAINSITDATATKPYTIKVYPGVYTESPITMKSWVSLVGADTITCIIKPSNINLPLLTLATNSTIEHFTIDGVTNSQAIYDASTTTNQHVDHLVIKNCLDGVKTLGVGTRTFISDIILESTLTRGIYCVATGTGGIICHGVFSNAITSLRSDSGEIWVFDLHIDTGTNALYVNGGEIDFHIVDVRNCTNVARLNNAGKIEGVGLDVHGGCTLHILQEDALSSMVVSSSQLNQDKISVVDISMISIDFNDRKPGDEGMTLLKELHIGTPEKGYESVFGEGDSYTRGMLVYTETPASAFVDVSANALSNTGSTFSLAGSLANNSIYIASSLNDGVDKLKHNGIKTLIQTAMVVGAGSIIAEYWNGTIWKEIKTMSVSASGNYVPYADRLFLRTGSEQIRYNSNILSDWVKNDPMAIGTTYYWTRYRVVADITTAPIFEQFKLHTSRSELNQDGWLEYFGKARPIGYLPWSLMMADKALNPPSKVDVYISDTLDMGFKKNSFEPSLIMRTSIVDMLPYDLDTSCPIDLTFSYAGDTANVGNILWNVRWGYIKDGDLVYDQNTNTPPAGTPHVTEKLISKVVANSGAGIMTTVSLSLDVSKMISRRPAGVGDSLWISIERDGTDVLDTYTGICNMFTIKPYYTKWCEGGHV